jgi:hypothetical protein
MHNNSINNMTDKQKLENFKLGIIDESELNIIHADEFSGITDNDLKGINCVTELSVINNPKITNINHMTNIKKLNISGYKCGVTTTDIKDLVNIVELDISENRMINNIDHLINLERLTMTCHREAFSGYNGSCGRRNNNQYITKETEKNDIFHDENDKNKVIFNKLKYLNLRGNSDIYDLSTLPSLVELDISDNYINSYNHIKAYGIDNLKNLEILILERCGSRIDEIKDLSSLTKLKKLQVSDYCYNNIKESIKNLNIDIKTTKNIIY